MRVNHDESGFTIIELLTVVAIIAIGAALAIGNMSKGMPRSRLIASINDLRQSLLGARSAAIRTSRLEKVCFFRDPDSTDRSAMGRIVRLECNQAGDSACGSALACDTAKDASSASPLYLTSAVTCVAGTWCMVSDRDIASGSNSVDHVSINQFRKADGSIGSNSVLEITFAPTGLISPARSTAGYGAGAIDLTNWDHCSPGLSGGTFTCTGFTNRFRVAYTLGGATQIKE